MTNLSRVISPTLYEPCPQDGAEIKQLVKLCHPFLEKNSTYSYLLLCKHFSSTCMIARKNSDLVGFISAYIPPQKSQTLFIWQIAVLPKERRCGLALLMLKELLSRPHLRNIKYIEATISLSNRASLYAFKSLAKNIDAHYEIKTGFGKELFSNEDHEDEYLFRIGPRIPKEKLK